MAILSGVNADQTVFMYGLGFDDLTFDTFVSANATSFVYLTPNGHRVAVSGNFVFPGAADEPTGAITSVQINLGNDVGSDILNGGDGHDSIYGQGGDDWVIGGDGNNYIDGGNGNDIAVYWLAVGAVTVDLTMSGDYQNTIGAGNDNLNSVGGILGSLFSDTLTGDGSATNSIEILYRSVTDITQDDFLF